MKTAVRPQCAPANTAATLEAEFRALGFAPGRPQSYSPLAAGIDAAAARKLVCPGCGRRGVALKPFQRGGSLRYIGACCNCGAAEEI